MPKSTFKVLLISGLFIVLYFFVKEIPSIYDYYKTGVREPEGQIVNGKKEGKWITYYVKGNIADIEHYKNDTLNGPSIGYSSDGIIRGKSNFKNGHYVDSVILYFPDGRPNMESWYDQNGKPKGLFKVYHKNGKLSQIGKYKDGKFDDTIKTFYPNGQLNEVWIYQKGERIGEWRYFDSIGNQSKTEVYPNDTLISKNKNG